MAHDTTKKQVPDWLMKTLVPIFFGGISAGGGTYALTSDLAARVAVVESKVEQLETSGDRVLHAIDLLDMKTEEGQKYLRDVIAKEISEVRTDVAVLKARR